MSQVTVTQQTDEKYLVPLQPDLIIYEHFMYWGTSCVPNNEAETEPDFHLNYENFQRVRFDF